MATGTFRAEQTARHTARKVQPPRAARLEFDFDHALLDQILQHGVDIGGDLIRTGGKGLGKLVDDRRDRRAAVAAPSTPRSRYRRASPRAPARKRSRLSPQDRI